jgi:hypothetical protein
MSYQLGVMIVDIRYKSIYERWNGMGHVLCNTLFWQPAARSYMKNHLEEFYA